MAVSKTVQDAIKSNGSRTSVEDVEAHLQELRNEVAALTRSLAAFGATKAEDYKAGIDKLTADAVDASSRAFESARAEARALEASLEDQIRSKPLQAVGIAAGIGFLVALMTRR